MSKCISRQEEYYEHEIVEGSCVLCGESGLGADSVSMREGLKAIQKMHSSEAGYFCDYCSPDNGPSYELRNDVEWPCPTRKLADQALGEDLI